MKPLLTCSFKPLILVGMPKAGKTTLGKALSEYLHLDFYDSDALLTEKFNLTMPELYAKLGEKNFREEEGKVICDVLAQRKRMILALGGGAVEGEVFSRLKQECVLYVKAEFHLVLSRIIEGAKIKGAFPRFLGCGTCENFLKEACYPCLDQKLKSLYEKRTPLYEAISTLTLTVTGEKQQDLTNCIKLLNEERW